MKMDILPENPYLLLTPGPLSTSKSVKAVMLRDWCTWDDDYNAIVQQIRHRLVELATSQDGYTAVLMQGSGTFSVESVLTSAVAKDRKLLVLANGAYGERMGHIATQAGIDVEVQNSGELSPPDLKRLEQSLAQDDRISHVAVVHCETTTGMLNPVKEIGRIVKSSGRTYIVDAMSSFGGIPMDIAELGTDFLVSSANKCIQGVPGFGFVIARRTEMEKCRGRARSLSLDLYDQWRTMEEQQGKWRFTSPTHTVRAFSQALCELDEEGGIEVRYQRYKKNHATLVYGMQLLGFKCLLDEKYLSPIITAFYSPQAPGYSFAEFYARIKAQGFVIYPGKVTEHETFRIGNIGEVNPPDIERLLRSIARSMFWEETRRE
ncbi:MAG: 2-aminoethylphosphonate--pyruvate transaminase [Desulfuromonadales bacterium]|jgi:2-aminoethylphosphonate-pyruvate transaminase